MSKLRERYIRDLAIRNYAETTQRNYVDAVKRLSIHYNMCPSVITEEEIKDFFKVFWDDYKSWSRVNIIQSAINILYSETLNQPYKVERLKRPKTEHKVKYILSQSEISRLLDGCKNLKHKLILMTMYPTGLRFSEIAA